MHAAPTSKGSVKVFANQGNRLKVLDCYAGEIECGASSNQDDGYRPTSLS